MSEQKRFWVVLTRGLSKDDLTFFLSKTLVPMDEIYMVKDAIGSTIVLRKMSRETAKSLAGRVNRKEYLLYCKNSTERVVHHKWNLKAKKYVSIRESLDDQESFSLSKGK